MVLFTTGRHDARKAKMLEVPREQYVRCARLRTEVCKAFADVNVSEKAAQESLLEQGGPEAFVEGGLEVREAEHFTPTMLGPAAVRNPGAAVEEEVEARAMAHTALSLKSIARRWTSAWLRTSSAWRRRTWMTRRSLYCAAARSGSSRDKRASRDNESIASK